MTHHDMIRLSTAGDFVVADEYFYGWLRLTLSMAAYSGCSRLYYYLLLAVVMLLS